MSMFSPGTEMICRLRTYIAYAVAACIICSTAVSADDLSLTEHQVKSAMVYNIVRYVTWPDGAFGRSHVFSIGVYSHSLNSAWSALQGKTIHDRKIVIKRSQDIDDLTGCQVIFLEAADSKHFSRLLASLKGHPVLTVSDIDNFNQYGGMVNLRVINNRITFTINLKSARESGLSLSSNLLKLAADVTQ